MDLKTLKLRIIRIFASSFLLIIGAIILIIWLWPSSPPPFIESLKNATPIGVELTQLTSSSVKKQDVAWSPDGKYLAYVKWYNPEIYLIDVGNKTENRVTNWNGWGNGGLRIFRYSRDGLEIYLKTEGNLWAAPIDGSEQRRITTSSETGMIDGSSYSDEDVVFFAGSHPDALWVVDLETGSQHQLLGNISSEYSSLDFSPDGGKIVFSAGVIGQYDPYNVHIALRHMWVINTDGTEKYQISDKYGEQLRWNPNGSNIAFLREDELWLINPDGTGEEKFPTEAYFIYCLEWSPEGNKLAFWSTEGRHGSCTRLWVVDFANGTQKPILDLTNTSGTWGYNDMAWSPDGNSIALILSGAAGEQVFLLKL